MSKAKLTVIFKWHEERQKYEVQAKLPGRRMLLGYFTKEELAAHDYFQSSWMSPRRPEHSFYFS